MSATYFKRPEELTSCELAEEIGRLGSACDSGRSKGSDMQRLKRCLSLYRVVKINGNAYRTNEEVIETAAILENGKISDDWGTVTDWSEGPTKTQVLERIGKFWSEC